MDLYNTRNFIVISAFMVWQLVEAFKKYYSYPADTNIGTGTKTAIEFPAVTFCNLNPMRLSALDEAGSEFVSRFGGEVTSWEF